MRGDDTYIVDHARDVASENLGASNIDRVTDFLTGVDGFVLDDLVFGSLGASVEAGELLMGAGLTAAADGDDFLIYNTRNGRLFLRRGRRRRGCLRAVRRAERGSGHQP